MSGMVRCLMEHQDWIIDVFLDISSGSNQGMSDLRLPAHMSLIYYLNLSQYTIVSTQIQTSRGLKLSLLTQLESQGSIDAMPEQEAHRTPRTWRAKVVSLPR